MEAYNYTLLTTAATTQIKPASVTAPRSQGMLHRLLVTEVGTTMTIDIHDAASGTTTKLVTYVSADGKVNWELNIPFKNGLRVIVGGTPGRAVVVWS